MPPPGTQPGMQPGMHGQQGMPGPYGGPQTMAPYQGSAVPAAYILSIALLALVVLYDLVVVVSVRWNHVFTFTGDVDDLSNVFPLTMAPIMLLTMAALALLAGKSKVGWVLAVAAAFLHVVGYTVNIVLPEAMPDTTRGFVHTVTRDSAGGVLIPALQVLISLAAAVVLLLPATRQALRKR